MTIQSSDNSKNNVPYIWHNDHLTSWKVIIEKIHKNNSKILGKLWYGSRILHSDFISKLKNNETMIKMTNEPSFIMNMKKYDKNIHMVIKSNRC